ncbi:unnamed protein product [Fraxinus pennsylvanica]|uniref:Uncharacterized protein n=1 Tax=Fraxinus pennsylvanica TaxID=56036 RepID=A0AAD2DTC8_9LAMI|nr:unnamed protein product [Fraxinus pennsylvanica]
MENQGKEDYCDIGSEDFPDEFLCCVCLDIVYKPVVLEEEKNIYKHESPQFDRGDSSLIQDSLENEDNMTMIPTTSNQERTTNMAKKGDGMVKSEVTNEACKQVSMTDLQCSLCKQLLCRPIVLNCGHGTTGKREQATERSSLPRNAYKSWLSGNGPKVHPGVGCDWCGTENITAGMFGFYGLTDVAWLLGHSV